MRNAKRFAILCLASAMLMSNSVYAVETEDMNSGISLMSTEALMELTETMNSITIPANTVIDCETYLGGIVMTVEGAGAYITINNETFYEDNGKVEILLPEVSGRYSTQFQIGNNSTAEMTYALSFAYPVGSYDNPENITVGTYSQTFEDGSTGYYYRYKAEQAGTVTVAVSVPEGTPGWQYSVSNLNTGISSDIYDSAAESPVDKEVCTVAAGDELEIFVGTFNPEDDFTMPAGTVYVSVTFVESDGTEGDTDKDEEDSEEDTDTEDEADDNKDVAQSGTKNNPEEITTLGEISAVLEEGDKDGYYFTWKATKKGKLVFEMTDAPVDVDYNIVLINGTKKVSLQKHGVIADGIKTVSINVKKGDVVTIQLITVKDATSGTYPAATLTAYGEMGGSKKSDSETGATVEDETSGTTDGKTSPATGDAISVFVVGGIVISAMAVAFVQYKKRQIRL